MIHLHTHSCFSFLRGVASPGALAQAAAAEQMPALALTDTNSLAGAIEFYDACRATGVQPLLGVEITVAAQPDGPRPAGSGTLVLLAMDLDGWRSLCRLVSKVGEDPDHAELPFDQFAANQAGLICLTGGQDGLAARWVRGGQAQAAGDWLGALGELFGDRLYVELPPPVGPPADWVLALAGLAQRLRLPCAAALNIHTLTPEDAPVQRLLTAIRRLTPLQRLPEDALPPPGSYFAGSKEMAARFANLPDALARTDEIAGRCRVELPLGQPHYPEIPLPAGRSALDVLRERAEAGAHRRYGQVTPNIQARLDHELSVIGELNYAPLFLIVDEIVQFARRTGVPMSSRGSAASSLVAYCLQITSPDPLRHNLYFERFLNPARATPPDIDTDLCSRRRERVIDFVYQRFGAGRVAMVCTINRFRRRSALREAGKAYGLPARTVSELVDRLPHRWWSPASRGTPEPPPYAELIDDYPQYTEIFSIAERIIGLPRHLSIHPGGVVIAPGPLTDLAPTQMAAKRIAITQLDLEGIERLGLVKIDLLGIRGLTVLGDVAEGLSGGELRSAPAFLSHTGDPTPLDAMESIAEDEPQTAELVESGRTIGCFQIESPGMRATLKEIGARSVDDVMVALALYRPGPLTGGLKDAFVRRHRGQEAVSHLHPALASLLEDTYGVVLYQEQVLRIAHELAGLSLADADLLRRAMSHFDPGRAMQTLKEKFVHGAQETSGVPAITAERVWELMAAFAGYGFPKAHAASYAQVSWRIAWCKAYHPAQFMAAVLANWGGYYSQRVYLTEARRLGLETRPPHVNYSGPEFQAVQLNGRPVLFMGLNQVRELTQRTLQRILQERPFHSLQDFLTRADPRPLEAENLARCGGLDGMGAIPHLLRTIQAGGWRGRQLALFHFDASGETLSSRPAPEEDWSIYERAAAEEAVLGLSVGMHPLELVASQIAAAGAITTLEAAEHSGQSVRVAGMRLAWRRTGGGRGELVYWMSLEDLEGMLDVIIPERVYRRYRHEFSEGAGPFLVEGTLVREAGTGEMVLQAGKVERIEVYK